MLKKNSRKNTRQGDKLAPTYTGPYTVHEVLGKGAYRLQNSKSEVLSQKVSASNLKMFHTVGNSINRFIVLDCFDTRRCSGCH